MHGFSCVLTCIHSYCVFQASLQEELATMQILLSEATDDSQVSGMFSSWSMIIAGAVQLYLLNN